MQAGVPVLLNTPLTDLNMSTAGGRVVVTQNGVAALINARRGVIVGSGGFEHNARDADEYQQQPIGTFWSVGAKDNTGDGILAGRRAGPPWT